MSHPPPFKPGDIASGKIKLDMSQFHDGMHWPGTKHCRSLYGGTRQHLKNSWQYHRKDQLLDVFRKPWHKITCKLDRHEPREHFRWNKIADDWESVVRCWWCGKREDA